MPHPNKQLSSVAPPSGISRAFETVTGVSGGDGLVATRHRQIAVLFQLLIHFDDGMTG